MQKQQTLSRFLPVAMLGVATFFYLYEFLLRVSPNVMERELIYDFKMDGTAFGLFSSCYYWSYSVLQLPVGALTDKYGPRRLLTFAIILCALSTLALAFTHSFFVSCVTRFFIGAGSAFAFISCLKIINVWFSPHLFPILTGLTLAIGTLGAAAGGTPLSLALDVLTWRELMIYLGAIGIILGFLAWKLIKDKNSDQNTHSAEPDNPPFWRCVKEVARQPQSWLVGIYAFFVTAPSDAFGGAWGVKFLVDAHEMSRDVASVAVTMTFVGMAVGSPLVGWISEILGSRKIPMFVSSVIAALALTLIVYVPHLSGVQAAILFFVFGAAATYVLAFVMTRRFTESRYVATAVGFVNMISMFGSAFLTYIIGWLLDTVHPNIAASGEVIYTVKDYHLSLIALPLFYVISALVIVPFIRDRKGP